MTRKKQQKMIQKAIEYVLVTIVCVIGATIIGYVFRMLDFPETNIVIIYIFSVVLTARFTEGFLYGVAASIVATGAFNYFFTVPYHTFSVKDPSYVVTFAVMALTAFVTSALTATVKRQAQEAGRREAEATALYHLTDRLAEAADVMDVAKIAVSSVSTVMDCNAACLCFDEDGMPEKKYIQQRNKTEQIYRSLSNGEGLKERMEKLQASYETGEEFCDFPIRGEESVLGVFRIPKERVQEMSKVQIRQLYSMLASTALAMGRLWNSRERIRAKEQVVQERYRGNLLRAISHDLRTPLSGIIGMSEMLMEMTEKEDVRYQMAEGIYKDAGWLHSLVENILSLTRIQAEGLELNRQPEAVDEVVEFAIAAIAKRMPDREIAVELPEEMLLVPMDAKLIGQVLVNLLDNALKHTKPENEIRVAIWKEPQKNQVLFSVADRGTGIAQDEMSQIFQMFYTTNRKGPDAQRGVGLGLTICESIVTAHGGRIIARNREDGSGAEFIFSLPMGEETNRKIGG